MSVGIGTGLAFGVRFRGGKETFLFSTAPTPALLSTQPPIQWALGALSPRVKGPRRESGKLSPSSADVKNYGAISKSPWRGAKLIKNRETILPLRLRILAMQSVNQTDLQRILMLFYRSVLKSGKVETAFTEKRESRKNLLHSSRTRKAKDANLPRSCTLFLLKLLTLRGINVSLFNPFSPHQVLLWHCFNCALQKREL
jgi:hypothetical protein